LAVDLGAALAHHDRVPLGRPDAGLKTDAGQILGHVLGGGLTLVLVGRIGRDRLDAQELEQSLEALIEIGVDLLQHGGEGMSGGDGIAALPGLLSGLSSPAERAPCAVRGGAQYRQRTSVPRSGVCWRPPGAAETAERVTAAKCLPWCHARWRGRPSCPF